MPRKTTSKAAPKSGRNTAERSNSLTAHDGAGPRHVFGAPFTIRHMVASVKPTKKGGKRLQVSIEGELHIDLE